MSCSIPVCGRLYVINGRFPLIHTLVKPPPHRALMSLQRLAVLFSVYLFIYPFSQHNCFFRTPLFLYIIRLGTNRQTTYLVVGSVTTSKSLVLYIL